MTLCHHNNHFRHSVFSMIISYSVMDGFTLQACSSHYKHLHGQQHKCFHVLSLESIGQTNMTSNSALCYESIKWKIHTMLYMTHWNIITLLNIVEAIGCYHIPPMILASAWIWTRLESTKISPTTPASARILKGFWKNNFFSQSDNVLCLSYLTTSHALFDHLPYLIMIKHSCLYIWGIQSISHPLTTNNTPM